MLSHIIVNYVPFQVNQDIYVYIDGECKHQTSVPLDEVNTTVKILQKEYSITRIDLCGNREYLSRFKAEMATQFEAGECEINIIGR